MSRERDKKRRRRGRRKKKGSLVLRIAFLFSAVVFGVSVWQLVKIGKGYLDGQNEYKRVKNIVVDGGGNKNKFRVDFSELMSMNEDTVGWIRFYPEPSAISYPLVQGEDQEYYLHRTFNRKKNASGAIFLDVDASPDFRDKNTIIYGHRMKDGSMFRHLQDYSEKEFWEKNQYFYIYTPYGTEITYHIYSVGEVDAVLDTYLTSFAEGREYVEFLNMTKETALYDTGVEVRNSDTIVTLSTCTSDSDNHRFVVRGVKEKEVELEE